MHNLGIMKTWLRAVLLVLTIGGGFAGVVFTLPYVLHPASFSNFVISLCFLLLYVFVIISGILFALNPATTWPLFTALLFQIPYISSPVVVYKFGAGCHSFLLIGPPETAGKIGLFFGFDGLIGSSWTFGYDAENSPWRLGINFVALALCMLSWKAVFTSAQEQPKIATSASIQLPTEVSR